MRAKNVDEIDTMIISKYVFLLSSASEVIFTKLCVQSKKLPEHNVWQKIRHSISPTFCLELCPYEVRLNLPN